MAWEPWVSESVFAFELASRLGFSVAGETVSVWHLRVTGTSSPPACAYQPLAMFDRPSKETFETQLKFLRAYADLRPDRAQEILEQMESPVPFLASVGFLRPDSKKWTLTLIDMVMDLCRMVEQRVKHGLACRRPVEYSPQVQPIILTPGHGTLPSGHATEAFATALVFWRLLQAAKDGAPGYGEQFMRLASRIAINRTVAGVHFPIDSVAGALLGLTLGDYFLARVGASDRSYKPAHFDGIARDNTKAIGERDFHWWEIYHLDKDDVDQSKVKFFGRDAEDAHPSVLAWDEPVDLAEHEFAANEAVPEQVLSPLEWLWRRALAEWKSD